MSRNRKKGNSNQGRPARTERSSVPTSASKLGSPVGLLQVRQTNLTNRVAPNVLFVQARFNPFEFFPDGALNDSMSYAGFANAEANNMFLRINDILFSATGSRQTFSRTEMLAYLNDLIDLLSLYYQLIGMKRLVDIDWENDFGETYPPELLNFKRRFNLNDGAFEATYGTAIVAMSRILAPSILHAQLAHFFSPYNVESKYNYVIQNHIIDTNPATLPVVDGPTYALALTDQINAFVEEWGTVHTAFRNFFPVVPPAPSEVYFRPGDPLLVNGITNCGLWPDASSAVPSTGGVTLISAWQDKLDYSVLTDSEGWSYRAGYRRSVMGVPGPSYKHYCLRADTTPTAMDLIFAAHMEIIVPTYNTYLLSMAGPTKYFGFQWLEPSADLLDVTYYGISNAGSFQAADIAAMTAGVYHKYMAPLRELIYDKFFIDYVASTSYNIMDAFAGDPRYGINDSELLMLCELEATARTLLPGCIGLVTESLGVPSLVGVTAMAGVRSGRTGQEATGM